jgi:hypothetical protein
MPESRIGRYRLYSWDDFWKTAAGRIVHADRRRAMVKARPW